MRLDKEWQMSAYDYRAAKMAYDEAKAKLEDAKDALLALSNGHDEAGFDVSVKWVKRKGSIDYQAALESVAPDFDAEPFRKPETVFHKITITGE